MPAMRWVLGMLAIMSPAQGAAQVSVEIGPVIGYYSPLGSFDDASVYRTSLPRTPQGLKGIALGGELRAWFGTRVGAEVDAMVAHSEVPGIFSPGGPLDPTQAQVTTLTAQGLLTVIGDPTRHHLWVSGGLCVVRHGGDAYAPLDASQDLGPAAGIGVRLGLARHLRATFGVNVLAYTFDVPMPYEMRMNPGSLQHAERVDVWTHLAVTWRVGWR